MDQLKGKILSLIETRQGFIEISEQLNVEIPQMILQLNRYYTDDKAFMEIVLMIKKRWDPIFSGPMRASVNSYINTYLNELEKLENLIQYAENLPIVKESQKRTIDDLADDLADLMDPLAGLVKSVKRTNIKQIGSKRAKSSKF